MKSLSVAMNIFRVVAAICFALLSVLSFLGWALNQPLRPSTIWIAAMLAFGNQALGHVKEIE